MKFWPVALFFLNALTAWACWSLRQMAKTEVAAAVAKLQARDDAICLDVDDHDTRITRVEGRVDGLEKDILDLPTKADIARLEGEVKAVGETAKATQTGIGRIEGYFLQRGVERAG